MKPLVCIGFAEAASAPEVVWSLVDHGFDVWAYSRRGRRPAIRWSRWSRVIEITPPETDIGSCVSELTSLLDSLRKVRKAPCVLLPIDDTAVWLCRQVSVVGWNAASLGPGCVELALDKALQIRTALAAGFNVPDSCLVERPADLDGLHSKLPVILRPARAVMVGGNRVVKGRNWICSNERELAAVATGWKSTGPLLVQPYLQGGGEGVFGFATAAGILCWSSHRRLRMMNPHGSGSSACAAQPVPREIAEPVNQFIKSSGWRGLFMIELLRDIAGRLWFVEFNGRAWGSLALARRQGYEYPAWTAMLALDGDYQPPPVSSSRGDLVCRNLGREFMHLLFVLKGPRSRAIAQWPSIPRTVWDLFRVRRCERFYNWRRDDWRVFLHDCCTTVRDNLFKR